MKKTLCSVSAFLIILALMGCSNSLDKQIVGKWHYTFETDLSSNDGDPPAKMKLNCTDEVFPNKSIVHFCKFSIAASTADQSGNLVNMEMKGDMLASGEWSVTDKIIYDKTVDGRIDLNDFVVNGNKVTDSAILAEMKTQLENPFVKGDTTKMKTNSIEKDKWTYEIEFDGKPISISASRM